MSAARLGAIPLKDGRCRFRVWAPRARQVEVRLAAPREGIFPLARDRAGYFQGVLEEAGPETLYFYRLDGGKDRPDPASRCQPRGVHGPSRVTAGDFPWEDQGWRGPALKDYAVYELHVGTFTPAGTFDAIIPRLEELKDLGVTALELMPAAQFPGERNWGYDGVFPFAAHYSYGGPLGLKRLVNACHRQGLAVVLDVVYNHLGPEGNYFGDFGPYFSERCRTPWGAALNFDGPDSDEVRRFFIANALYWLDECHIDALRLDALHGIFDHSPRPFLAELAQAVHARGEELGRRIYLFAESDWNDVRLIRSPEEGGYGLDAHWHEDFHHALHALLTGERDGYYQDFGSLAQMAKAFREGFVYSGQYSPYRRRGHGSSSRGVPPRRFLAFAQNHDQVGNRAKGERLSRLVSFEALKLAAAAVILSPYPPLLFMGEEYGETAPFQYFISHGDPELADAVRRARQEEFAALGWPEEPPDPQSEETFQACKLNYEWRRQGEHRLLREFYRELLRLRREVLTAGGLDLLERETRAEVREKVLWVHYLFPEREAVLVLNFSGRVASLSFPWPGGRWRKLLDSAAVPWGGPGSPGPEEITPGADVPVTLAPHSLQLLLMKDGES